MNADTRRRTTTRLARALGLAGVAGVAATGVLLARAERRRRAVTPEQVRDRLHERHRAAEIDGGSEGDRDA
jgi:hypothetical protein